MAKRIVKLLTPEEKIADLLKRFINYNRTDKTISLPTRDVSLGQRVVYGNLHDVHVHSILENGKVLVLEYTHLPDKNDHEFYQDYIVSYWFDVYPYQEDTVIKYPRRNIWNKCITTNLETLINRALHEEFRDNTDYQRDYVWTPNDKLKFISSIFEGRELGKFIFIKFPYPDNEYEILDGKQRVNAIKEFILGKFQFNGDYWHNLHHMDKHYFETTLVQYVDLDGGIYKKSELLKMFLEVNQAGVPQSEEHLFLVQRLYRKALELENINT